MNKKTSKHNAKDTQPDPLIESMERIDQVKFLHDVNLGLGN